VIHTLDPESTMSVLKDGVTKSIAAYFPLQGRVNTLVADKVYPGDNEIDIDDVHSQKRARLRGRTWAIPIYGDFRLIDNKSGNVVAQAKKVSLVQLPHITRRYSYIVDGAEYQADHQWRLRTGAYSRIKANGELETQFNVEKGKGFRVQFDPVGKKVTMQYGTANLPAYPILRMLGISDDSMKSSWGPELFASASKEPKKGQFLKLAKILDKRAVPTTDEEAAEVIKARLAETKLDPKTTEVTLGKQFSNVTGEAILRASNKLVDINRGVDEPDQRDSLLFKELWNIGDHIPERITNSRMRVINKLRNNVDRKETIREIVSPDIFGVPVKSFFTTTSLAQQTNQTNPIDMIGNHLRTTLMGTGGIGSDNAVSFDAKLTHPSQLGVIDPVHTPEGASSGISTHLALGVSKRGNDPTTRLWDVRGKEWVDRSPLELRKSTVAFADQYSISDSGAPVARTPSVVVVTPGGGDPKEIPAGQVDYVMRSPKAMFSFAANLVPFLPSVQANRAEMATRHLEQTISLTHREEPIVQSATGAKREDILTWERLLGKSHSMRAKVAGTVTAVDAEKIVVKGADGKSTTTQLYENFPLNEKKTFTHSEPLVKKGDVVKADQVLADTNFTRNGVLAMGVNLRVGYMAFRGGTFEDGLVISESAAEKLRSEHLSKERLFADTDAIFNLKKFRANFPGTVTEANAKKLDDDGIIRKGETVGPGDTLIASMRKSEPSPEQVMLKGIHKALAKPFKDLSVSWDRRVTGTVTDVVRNGKETVVYVKTSEVADVGDKLCYAADHEILTVNGWKYVADIRIGDLVASLRADGYVEYVPVRAIQSYGCKDENLYLLETTQVSMAVTMDHGLWAMPRGKDRYAEYKARDLYGKRYSLKMDGRWRGEDQAEFVFPAEQCAAGQHGRGLRTMPEIRWPMDTFLMVLGMQLSEGNCVWSENNGDFNIQISQVKPENVAQLREALNDANVRFRHDTSNDKFIITGKQITRYFMQFGLCHQKFIPEWVFSLPPARLRVLYKWLMWGDGCEKHTGHCYTTTSKRLADDVQRLLLHIGMAGWIDTKPACSGEIKGQTYQFRECHKVYIYRDKLRPTVNHGHVNTQDGQTECLVSYTGNVHCVTLDRNHVLYTRRNGRVHWSCNSGRSGNKGIISAVLPDEEMPHDKDGNPLEIIMNFSGVPGRINPAQVLETSVTNAAAKEGKIVVVDNFQPDDAKKLSYANPMGEIHVKGHYRTVKTEEGEKRIWIAPYSYAGKGYHGVVTAALEKSGVSETTELIDPETKKSLGKVLVGYEYVLKHMHQVDKKLNARAHGYGYGYDANMVPRGTGNHDGAQRYGELGMYAMLAHGAVHNIRDSLSYKSDRTADEVWTAVQTGQPLPAPRPSFAYEKFLAYLKGVGLNVEKVGNELKLVPLTDRQVLEMSSGEIKDGAKVLRGKDLRPEDGGLFDIKTTGGPGGKKWSHLALPEPIPNPLFEPAILAILGLTGKEYDGILTANNSLNGATGPGALVAAIEGIEVDKELEKAKGQLRVARRDELNRVNRKIKYLLMLKKNGLTPKDVYVVKNVPVLPPIFRPVTAMESGDLNVDGVNLLYRDISIMSQKLKESRGVLPPAELATLRKDIYDAAAALTGIGGEEGQLTDGSERPAGLLGMITGKVPKTSFFHTKLMDRKQDLTARSVIIPDMSLALDELSIPRKAAAVIYRPFVVKELVQMGYTPLAAKEEIAKDTSLARKALEIAANKRPVLFKRDPVLHSYGIMAFKPRITEGMAIGIHPLLTGGFNADFDGDQMSIFVPLSQDAVEEAYKMLPSKHLFSVSTGKVMYQPTLEGQLGLYLLTQFGKKTNKKFGSDKEAIEAADRGEVSYTDVMNIGGRETTPGRAKVYATLPEKLRSDKYYTDPTFVLGKGNLAKVLTQLGQDTPGDFATSIDKLKNIGFGYAHTSGFSFSLDDFSTLSDIRDKHLLAARKQIAINAVNQRLTPQDREEKAVALYMAADKAIGAEAKVELRRRGSKLLAMNEAGVKPGWDQLKQLVIAPVLLQNAAGRVIPVPVAHSYSEGVSMSDYYIGSEGARKGLIEKVQSVREPGALSKQLINTAIPLVVTSKDCGTAGGLAMDVSSTDIIDRYLSKPVKLSSGETIARGTLVSPAIAAKMMAAKAGRVIVGSPLKCELPKGLCAHCYGADAQGHGIKLGTNIGVISGQSIGERGTQLSMKTFHTGGAAGADSKVVGGLERVTQLLKMPEVLAGKATLAPSTGKIDKVEESTLGGFNVTVGDKHLYVPGGRTLTVKAGDEIRKGDPISSGPIDPRELLALTDMDRVQRYLTDELHGVYADEGVKRRNVEVVIRALTDLGTVDNPGEVGEDAGLTRGDHVGLAFIESLNKKALSEGRKPIEVQPILKGVETLPLDRSTDWLARMQYRRLKETLVRGANEGWSSNIHDVHPVPGLVYSAEFGRKDKTVEGNPY
jgi:DNA-directed RNA polymerase subunit beta'